MPNILLVEDNEPLRQLMKINLTRRGYVVFEAVDGKQALDMLEQQPIHLLISDIMMPNIDGFELTTELRNANYSLPVLLVTAKDAMEDKRIGFKAGADDYMVKPIDMEEMVLRIEALLRRSRIASEHILNIGEVSLDQDSLSVQEGNKMTVLPPKEFFLLYKLLSYPNKIFTRQALMDEIWGYDSETDPRTVDVHIKRLREKFAEEQAFAIQTVRGLGYRAVIKI